jgi:SAM-dependent methyltransferase
LLSVSESSAAVVVPLVMGLVAPSSVVDFGCGEGIWLHRFADAGAAAVLGIDGSWARPRLQIPAHEFVEADLALRFPALGRRFDLAVCLEVAEHLPASRAPALVAALVAAAPTVLFSAAIPGQDGTNHVNCQWPAYWAELFGDHGYRAVDCLRRQVWNSSEVAFYYQQNLLLYRAADEPDPPGFPVGTPERMVHPATYDTLLLRLDHSVPRATGPLLSALSQTAPRTAARLAANAWGRVRARCRLGPADN